jgi:hypothetical protein
MINLGDQIKQVCKTSQNRLTYPENSCKGEEALQWQQVVFKIFARINTLISQTMKVLKDCAKSHHLQDNCSRLVSDYGKKFLSCQSGPRPFYILTL